MIDPELEMINTILGEARYARGRKRSFTAAGSSGRSESLGVLRTFANSCDTPKSLNAMLRDDTTLLLIAPCAWSR